MLWITRGKPSWPTRDRKGMFIKTSPVCNEFATISKQSTFIRRVYVIGKSHRQQGFVLRALNRNKQITTKNGLEQLYEHQVYEHQEFYHHDCGFRLFSHLSSVWRIERRERKASRRGR